jgi:hypothetical protein
MLTAALPILKNKAPEIAVFAEGEFKKIALTIATIETELARGEINEHQAKLPLDIQKSATRSVLLASEGLSLLVVEASINAALDVVRAAVNGALEVALV